uniref:ZP domain-containing protein n=1 Tax=Globodera pallida TaxID=36090 RepID=A0A183CKY0_GLOPA
MSEERDYADDEEEQETTSISIEMNGEEAKAEERLLVGGHNGTNERMDGGGVNLVEELSSTSSGRTTTPVATDASNSMEQQQQFSAQQKKTTTTLKALTALVPSKVHLRPPNKRRKSAFVIRKKEFVSDASAAPSIAPTDGPTPPAPPTTQQKQRHQFRALSDHRHSKTAARTFASGRYEPPAQRPPMLPRMPSRQPDDSSDLLAPKRFLLPSPQAPFSSPAGHQYAPLWSPAGAAFAVPSSPAAHVSGIAYYAPNSDGHGEDADANSGVHYEQKKAPVLLIGAFPPSAKVRPFLSPSPAFSSQYSPPNAPLAGKYYPPATSPPSQTFPDKIPSKLPEFATQTQRNIPAEFAETPPISLRFPPQSETTAAPTMPPAYSRLPHFPTLTSARPAEFTVPPPPPSGHFIPGRPYQPSRGGGGSSTMTAPTVPKNECDETDILPPASLPQPTEAPRATVPNRAVGRARIICKENGMEFALRTVFPFTGQIFAHDKKRIAGQQHINISFSFAECGVRNQRDRFATAMEQFHVQIVVMFQQQNGTSNVQSFFVQCGQQNIAQREKHPPMARHIEEALEELHIVPIELEQKAPLPIPTMRFLSDVHGGGADGAEVDGQLQIGQSLRVEFALQPETEAFGFLVRNCVVRDAVRGVEHEVIDRWGIVRQNAPQVPSAALPSVAAAAAMALAAAPQPHLTTSSQAAHSNNLSSALLILHQQQQLREQQQQQGPLNCSNSLGTRLLPMAQMSNDQLDAIINTVMTSIRLMFTTWNAHSLWHIVLMNIALLFTILLAALSLLVEFSFDLFNFLIEWLVFLTTLYICWPTLSTNGCPFNGLTAPSPLSTVDEGDNS